MFQMITKQVNDPVLLYLRYLEGRVQDMHVIIGGAEREKEGGSALS